MATVNSFPIETKTLAELTPSLTLGDNDLIHLDQGGTDKHITGEVSKQAHGGIIPWSVGFPFLAGGYTDRNGVLYSAVQNNTGQDPELDVTNTYWVKVVDKVELKSGRKNAIINGGFDIQQRGNSFTSSGYTFDRWFQNSNNANTDVATLAFESRNYKSIKITRKNSAGSLGIDQYIELRRAGIKDEFSGKWTVSFLANSTGTPTVSVSARWTDGSSQTNPVFNTVTAKSGTAVSATTAFYVFEIDFDSAAPVGSNEAVGIRFNFSSLGIGEEIEIARVQLEKGSYATDFEQRSIGEELTLCQRYYEIGRITNFRNGIVYTTSRDGVPVQLKVSKRMTPSFTIFDELGNLGRVSIYTDVSASITHNIVGAIETSGIGGFSVSKNQVINSYGILVNYVADAEL